MLKYVAQGYVNTDTERKSGPALDVVVDNWLVGWFVGGTGSYGWMDGCGSIDESCFTIWWGHSEFLKGNECVADTIHQRYVIGLTRSLCSSSSQPQLVPSSAPLSVYVA